MDAVQADARSVDARIAKSRELALDTATQVLIASGLSGFNHRNIAVESGLSRATLYRHWPDITDLMVDVLGRYTMPDFVKVNGDLRTVLHHNLDVQTKTFFDPKCARVFQAVGHFAQDPRVAEHLRVSYSKRAMSLRAALLPHAVLNTAQAEDLLALMLGPTRQMVARNNYRRSEAFAQATLDACVSYIDNTMSTKA